MRFLYLPKSRTIHGNDTYLPTKLNRLNVDEHVDKFYHPWLTPLQRSMTLREANDLTWTSRPRRFFFVCSRGGMEPTTSAVVKWLCNSYLDLPFVCKICVFTLGIQSPCQMMIGVYNHLLRKVFSFHYHSQFR